MVLDLQIKNNQLTKKPKNKRYNLMAMQGSFGFIEEISTETNMIINVILNVITKENSR